MHGGRRKMKPEEYFEKCDIPLLVDAIRLWTGKGNESYPRRNDSRIIDHYGREDAFVLLTTIRHLENEFYQTDARNTAPDLKSMAQLAETDFRERYPNIPEAIVEALVWCYTYDYK